jgi:hypothetical protein
MKAARPKASPTEHQPTNQPPIAPVWPGHEVADRHQGGGDVLEHAKVAGAVAGAHEGVSLTQRVDDGCSAGQIEEGGRIRHNLYAALGD